MDNTEEYRIRLCAANTIAAGGDEKAQMRLKPLALSISAAHSELELKCAALKCLWPNHISAAELFGALPVPINDKYGSYAFFLRNGLPESLKDKDLPHALRWAGQLNKNEASEYSVRDLVAIVARRGWDRLDLPTVFDAFVNFSLQRLANLQDVIPRIDKDFVDDETMRRSLVESIVPRIDDFDKLGFGLIFEQPRLIRESDVSWMIGKLRNESNRETRVYWAKLIGRLFDSRVSGQLNEVIKACELSPELQDEFQSRFAAIPFESPEALRQRERYAQHLKRQKDENEAKNSPPLKPPPSERIESALQAYEQGNVDAWFYASRDLQLEANTERYDHDLDVDLTKLPGWQTADYTTRTRLIKGAQDFLCMSDAEGDKWLGTNSIPYHALWGYKAFLLLRTQARQLFDSLPADVWSAWAPIIVEFSDYAVPEENKDLHDEIARICAEKAPEAVSESLRKICERYSQDKGMFNLPQFIERAWTESVQNILCELSENPGVKPVVVGRALDALLSRDSQRGREIAVGLIDIGHNLESETHDKRIAVTVALLRHTRDAAWTVVWPVIQRDEKFGRAVFLKVAYADMHNPSVATKISESDVADLYIWLERTFPASEDPRHSGPHYVGPRDAIKEYRDGTLRVLQHRGTPAAVEAMLRIERELPHLDWMHRVVVSAKATMLRNTWRPLKPGELLSATQQANTCFVRGPKELQEVVLESLESLQVSLRGETPAAPDLWDEVSRKKYRPKDENHLSDYVKRHLERDLRGRGIVSLREVEIRRGEGSGCGERTDIHVTGHVEGIVPGTLDQVRVIIEVKGSWHSEVDTAMESQLLNRYLKDNDCQHGIYIVGWYRCEQWDGADRRFSASRNETAQELLRRCTEQANQLSRNGIIIRPFVINAALR